MEYELDYDLSEYFDGIEMSFPIEDEEPEPPDDSDVLTVEDVVRGIEDTYPEPAKSLAIEALEIAANMHYDSFCEMTLNEFYEMTDCDVSDVVDEELYDFYGDELD